VNEESLKTIERKKSDAVSKLPAVHAPLPLQCDDAQQVERGNDALPLERKAHF
jgi:hypothetical protein